MSDEVDQDFSDEQAVDAATHEQARREYETLFDLYQHPGWKAVMIEVASQIAQLQDVRRASATNIDRIQGALQVLDAMALHEDMNKRAYDMMFAPAQVH